VGVPNTGAPSAIKVLLQGSNFDNPFLSDNEMKKIAKNLPAIYDLIPSRQYYEQKGSYVRVVRPSTSTSVDLNFDETTSFLNIDHGLNSQALSEAQTLHTSEFDNFDVRTSGIDLYSINGCKAGTLGKVVELRDTDIFGNEQVTYSQLVQTPGDSTVPLESATNLPIDSANKYYALKGSHGKMLSQDDIRQHIVNLLSGSSLPVSSNAITQDIDRCKLNGKAISIYSPLSIDVTDQAGNHSGMASDGGRYNNIPNANFEIMGEHKFVYLPTDEGQVYDIKVKGTGDGTFTLENANISNNQTTSIEVFSDIPVTTALKGTLDLGTSSTLSLDINGDGNTDEVIQPDGNQEPTLNELIALIKTKVSTLVVKDKLKQNLLKQISNLEKKIENKKQRNAKVLANLEKRISRQELKGKISSADATSITNLLDILEAQSESVTLDPMTLVNLKTKIQSLNIKTNLKNDMLKRVESLSKKQALIQNLNNLSNNITKKTGNGKITDTDAQALLDLLSQIESAI
jgi:hypothetical protein